MPETPSPPPADDTLKSMAKAMRVLDCFSTADRALSLVELARRTGLPKSTAHRLIAGLREAGLLDQDRERDRYRLGLKLFELGNMVLANMDLHREARPHIDSLVRLSGQTVHLAVFDGRQAVVVHRGDPHREGPPSAFVESAPIHCTGVGKAILAFQPPATIARIAAAGLARFTEATITAPEALAREVGAIQARAYAIDDGEHQPGVRCVAAPIRDATGRVFAAISVSGPAWRIPVSEIEAASRLVRHTALAISTALGFRPD